MKSIVKKSENRSMVKFTKNFIPFSMRIEKKPGLPKDLDPIKVTKTKKIRLFLYFLYIKNANKAGFIMIYGSSISVFLVST